MAEMFMGRNASVIQSWHFFLLALVCIWIATLMAKNIGALSGVLFSWVSLDALRLGASFTSPYTFDDTCFYLLSLSGVRSLLVATLVCFLVVQARRETLWKGLWVLALVSSVIMLFNHGESFYGNPSMDGSFLACVLPSMLFRKEFKVKGLILIPFLAIVASRSVTSGLAVIITILWTATSLKRLGVPLLASASVLLLFPFHHGITVSSGRVELWERILSFFREGGHYWVKTSVGMSFVHILNGSQWLFGFGSGAYTGLEPVIHDHFWLWPHNDYLEMFFDQGPIFLTLVGILILSSIWNARKVKWLSSSIVAASFVMLTQPLLREIPGAFYVALLVKESRHEY